MQPLEFLTAPLGVSSTPFLVLPVRCRAQARGRNGQRVPGFGSEPPVQCLDVVGLGELRTALGKLPVVARVIYGPSPFLRISTYSAANKRFWSCTDLEKCSSSTGLSSRSASSQAPLA